MPVLRLCGGRVSMRCSPNRMRPLSSSQKPATMRSSVVLPQPEGPSSVKNSPSRISIETASTARTAEKLRTTSSIVIAVTPAPLVASTSLMSARAPNNVLDLLRGLDALLDPCVFVVVHDLDVGELRHLSRQLRQVEILPGSAPECESQDLLAHVLARHIVDKLLCVVGIRAALDHGDAFHLRDSTVRRIDHLYGRAVRGPLIAGIFERHAERELAAAHALKNEAGTIEDLGVRHQSRHLFPGGIVVAPELCQHG